MIEQREILFKGQTRRKGEKVRMGDKKPLDSNWVYGGVFPNNDGGTFAVIYQLEPEIKKIPVYADTVCQYTGMDDKYGTKIFENDIVKLVLPDGEVRYFKVSIKKVIREVVNHSDFMERTSKVEITGVVFEWNGYELFPCTDTFGVPDYKEMEVVGNIFDTPELLKECGI